MRQTNEFFDKQKTRRVNDNKQKIKAPTNDVEGKTIVLVLVGVAAVGATCALIPVSVGAAIAIGILGTIGTIAFGVALFK